MNNKPPLQKILEGILHWKESFTQRVKTNITMKGWEILNLKRRTDK
jgi:hypothetical protein